MLNGVKRTGEAVAMVMGLGLLALVCLTWTPFALLLNPILPERTAKRIGRRAIQTAFWVHATGLAWLCGCRFDLKALRELAKQPGPMIVVANHPSLLDAVLLVSQFPDAVCIMKAGLMNNVLLGAGSRMARYIVNDAPLPMIRRAMAELNDGARLIVFPEGTRTSEPPVGPCGATVGLIAARTGVPVQVLAIEMSSPYLGKHWPLLRPPQLPLRVTVRLIETLHVTNERAQKFGHDIRLLLSNHLTSANCQHGQSLEDRDAINTMG